MTDATQGNDDPREHTREIKGMLREAMEHVRADVPKGSPTRRRRRCSRPPPRCWAA
jgi:hypothetical protein